MIDHAAPRLETNDGVGQPDGGGRKGGGESGGGAYKDPDQVKGNPDPNGHGGQSNVKYHGPGDAGDGNSNPNAVADSD
jgi:hypothetical protein